MSVIKMDFSLFRADGSDRRKAERRYLSHLEALVKKNVAYLRAHPKVPWVYKSGVVLRTLVLHDHHYFLSIPQALHRNSAPIDAIACWRCAELRLHGKKAQILLRRSPRAYGGVTISTHIRLPSGKIEQPEKRCARDEQSSVPLEEMAAKRAVKSRR